MTHAGAPLDSRLLPERTSFGHCAQHLPSAAIISIVRALGLVDTYMCIL